MFKYILGQRNQYNWREVRLLYSFVLVVFLFTSCVSVVPEKQLILGKGAALVSLQEGSCDHYLLSQDSKPVLFGSEELDPWSITLLSWNVYKGQLTGWEKDLQRYGANKDIIFLQEASLNISLKETLQELSLHWMLNNAFRFKGQETGVLLASSIQPLNQCGLRQSEPLTGYPKTILIGRYGIKNTKEELLVINVHSINFSLGLGAYRNQLTALTTILKQHDGPIILAGDFNNWKQSRTEVIGNFTKQFSLQKLIFATDKRTQYLGSPVDHIYYRSLEPITVDVQQILSSDHNPIMVTFKFSPGN